LSLREREFVEAAKASGATSRHIVFKQLLPNLWAPVIVIVSLSLPGYVATESTLSFLGLGLMQPAASWGVMLGDSVRYYRADKRSEGSNQEICDDYAERKERHFVS
jgi:peptide/nickel transport system permease protein